MPGRSIDEIDAAFPELRARPRLVARPRRGRARPARLVVALTDYGFLRLRPDVMGWAERVIAADPEDASPRWRALVWRRGYARVDGRRHDRDRRLAARLRD